MLPKICKITKIVDETSHIKTFFVDKTLEMEPGQFFMVWIPGVDEKPLTLSYTGKNPAITVRIHGKGTKAMFKLKVGDKLGFRGPYGKGFTIHNKRVVLVAGGIGMIALATLAERLPNATIICGAKRLDSAYKLPAHIKSAKWSYKCCVLRCNHTLLPNRQ